MVLNGCYVEKKNCGSIFSLIFKCCRKKWHKKQPLPWLHQYPGGEEEWGIKWNTGKRNGDRARERESACTWPFPTDWTTSSLTPIWNSTECPQRLSLFHSLQQGSRGHEVFFMVKGDWQLSMASIPPPGWLLRQSHFGDHLACIATWNMSFTLWSRCYIANSRVLIELQCIV